MKTPEPATAPFKQCGMCQHAWADAIELVCDRTLELAGYQAAFDDPETGLFLMLHRKPDCLTTIGIRAGKLRHFYQEPVPTELLAGQNGCPGHCFSADNLEPCNHPCRMAWVRQVLQYLRNHEVPPHLREPEDEAAEQPA
jgi:hypothetical protein